MVQDTCGRRSSIALNLLMCVFGNVMHVYYLPNPKSDAFKYTSLSPPQLELEPPKLEP